MEHQLCKIGQRLLLAFVMIGMLSSCRVIESITTERTVRVDTVQVVVPVPGWRAMTSFAEGDSLFYEDDRIRLRIIPEPATNMPNAEGQVADPVPIGDADSAVSQTPTNYRVDVEVKDDTVQTKVPEKTITEKTETTVVQKEMPNWGWIVIGGLAMLALILIAVFKINKR